MRESYRLQKIDLQNHLRESHLKLSVFFIYVGNELPEYKEVYEKIGGALQRLKDGSSSSKNKSV